MTISARMVMHYMILNSSPKPMFPSCNFEGADGMVVVAVVLSLRQASVVACCLPPKLGLPSRKPCEHKGPWSFSHDVPKHSESLKIMHYANLGPIFL